MRKQRIGLPMVAIGILCVFGGCMRSSIESESVSDNLQVVAADTITIPVDTDSVPREVGMPEIKEEDKIETSQSTVQTTPVDIVVTGGIMERIAEQTPDYFAKLQANTHNGFVVVDKETMRVLLYDRNGNQQKSFPMACARNYGTKHRSGDNRTPEGFFTVQGVYNSTDWLYTDEKGVTSKTKGVYGPRFIRLNTPVTSSVGIHGTVSPGSLGKRVSHGCIRIANQNILELAKHVEPGMPVIVLPSAKDKQVNRKEGYNISSFSTLSAAEEAEQVQDSISAPEAVTTPETITVPTDSV